MHNYYMELFENAADVNAEKIYFILKDRRTACRVGALVLTHVPLHCLPLITDDHDLGLH